MAELKYEIVENLGSLGENARGWSKEVNLISWNEKEPKYDIRDWAPDHSRMGKGVTLTADELAALKDLLAGIWIPLNNPETERVSGKPENAVWCFRAFYLL